MSRWFRFYDDAINDPKILKLPEASRWHWAALLCIASKHDGVLPPTDDVALMLRVKPAAAAAIIAGMKNAGLLDFVEGKFAPHNWSGRQYKSDTSNERVKRYRQRKCNVTDTVTVTPPETEADTEQKQIPEASASGADAPDHRKRLFSEGLAKLAKITGKGPDACRSFVGKCLKASDDDAVTVLGLIEDAERNQTVDPAAWIAARLKPMEARNGSLQKAESLSHVARRLAENGIAFGERPTTPSLRSIEGGADVRLLPSGGSERPGNLRSGDGGGS